MTSENPSHSSLDILLLAPHPFYQERGTPMAVDMLLGVLSRRGLRTALATFAEGEERAYPHVAIHRIADLPLVGRGIAPGLSLKKLVCDVFLFGKAFKIVRKTRPRLIHAVEESVFMALVFRTLFKIPYIYDMDSSMSLQIIQKKPLLKPLGPFFRWIEGLAIRRALMVIPVCNALADVARASGAARVRVLCDVSMLSASTSCTLPKETLGESPGEPSRAVPDLRCRYAITGTCFMYVGNLERYQGIDLLLESLAIALQTDPNLDMVIVGGRSQDIANYQERCRELGIAARVHFTGHLSVAMLHPLLQQADAVVSPRISGENTPMKIYSYLDSGRPILATDLLTHTQVLTPEVAELVHPDAPSMAAGMLRLSSDAEHRQRLARTAKELAACDYSPVAFERNLNAIYDDILGRLEESDPPSASPRHPLTKHTPTP
ncbi:glycosyltransferase family 4 protein [Desulfonatronum sp. SC1]|uniref:glycosyltransferase family 4 protein n=1 Tax=Desulfonatronum sp. SC1 TaxID=2109626 RepID=UPI000D3104B5|nr:glycosyltransferase family 4 protein [Desulfonatronum sp. SC1]PTN36507.1 glycosyl transferase family 1 [Desulfonatronum sp. SC1]